MLRVLVAVVLVFTGVGVTTVTGSHPHPSASLSGQSGQFLENQQLDRQTFRIEVYKNGSVRWTHVYRRDLASQSEREQFKAFAEQFNERKNPEMSTNFKQGAKALVKRGTNHTGRQMNASSFTHEAYVSRLDNSGIVKMSFLWSNFSVRKENRIIVGDVLTGVSINSNQRFEVTWIDGLAYQRATPQPDDRSSDTLTWVASDTERQFNDSRPSVVFTTNTTVGNHSTRATPLSQPWLVGTGVIALLAVGVAIAHRRNALSLRQSFETHEQGHGDPDESTPTITEADLMTDEDRVISLLRDNGGRMKQVKIVEQTGWSKSKVSMLLSDMEEEQLISKLRVGRENIISLTGDEPDAARSPFEDE